MVGSIPEPSWGPNITVSLNALSTVLLVSGYVAIRRGNREAHKRIMVGALISSAAFLCVYLLHHGLHGSTHYPFKDWSYTLYLVILVPHMIIAALIVPFILRGVWLAWKERFDGHARVMRFVWPVWLYVAITGILVYLMLYIYPRFVIVPQ